MNTVLIFSGRLGSGKSALSKAVAKRLKFGWNGFSATLRRMAADQGMGEARTDLQKLGEALVATRAEEFCRRVLDDGNDGTDGIVIDGLRHGSMKVLFERIIGVARILYVYVNCSEAVRLERLATRDGLTADQVAALECHSTERDVAEQLRSTADIVIDNSGTIEDALSQTVTAIGEILASRGARP